MKYLIITIMMGFVLTTSVNTQPQFFGKMDLKEKLNLTDEQEEAIKSIRIKTAKEMIDIGANIQKKRIDMKELMSGNSPERSQVEKMTKEIADLQVQRKMLGFDTMQEIMNVLTPEQNEQFKKLQNERRSKMRHQMEKKKGHSNQMGGPFNKG